MFCMAFWCVRKIVKISCVTQKKKTYKSISAFSVKILKNPRGIKQKNKTVNVSVSKEKICLKKFLICRFCFLFFWIGFFILRASSPSEISTIQIQNPKSTTMRSYQFGCVVLAKCSTHVVIIQFRNRNGKLY